MIFFRSVYTYPGIILCGDFNNLDTSFLAGILRLKQLVNLPTRGLNILDKFFTNFSDYFTDVQILPPLGRSDHKCVLVVPRVGLLRKVGYRYVVKRVFNNAVYDSIAKDLLSYNWSNMYLENDVQKQADIFYSVVTDAVERHAPVKQLKFKNNDKPWVTIHFKVLIAQRNYAFKINDVVNYHKLRNKVNRIRKSLRKDYLNDKIINGNGKYNSQWWKDIKELCGLKKSNDVSVFNNCEYRGEIISSVDLPTAINDMLVELLDNVPAISMLSNVSSGNDNGNIRDESEIIISEFDVFMILSKLNSRKATLFSVIDNRLLRNLADVLAAPVCALINSSIRQRVVPKQWKIARIAPLPKRVPVSDIETDIRPISVTCPVSKVAEYFMSRVFDEHFDELTDDCQFGSVSGRSTTLALVKFAHMLFESSDDSSNIIRVLFVDFNKAFDLINHNVVSDKLVANHFSAGFSAWFLSFLTERSQFVKIGENISDLRTVDAGAPQGTRAGPNAFKLLVNDLVFKTACIKYVDDLTISTVSHDLSDSGLQEAADYLDKWCKINGMKLNTVKTKEMVLNFNNRFDVDQCRPIVIDGNTIERVKIFKLLGVFFSADLSWRQHVTYIIAKANKRVFVIYQLVRNGFDSAEIIKVYCTLVRPTLEYASPVWHCGLTQVLSDEIEAVQRRCLRIIFPFLSYSDALQVAALETLSARRESAVVRLFAEIKNEGHVLHKLLPVRLHNAGVSLRNSYPYVIPRAKTSRMSRSLISYCISRRL